MIVILIYAMIIREPVTYYDLEYPDSAYALGWCIVAFGLIQLPIFASYAIFKANGDTMLEVIFHTSFSTKKVLTYLLFFCRKP